MEIMFFIVGKSLLWVAVLGLVIFYLYALLAFALFRDVFNPRTQMFCGSLWQCTVTIIRYGLVGDYDEVSKRVFSGYKIDSTLKTCRYFASKNILCIVVKPNLTFATYNLSQKY